MWLTRLALRNPVLILMMSLMALALGAVAVSRLSVAISGEGLDEKQLYDLAYNTIEPQLERLTGVASASVSGGKIREIDVQVQRDALRARNLDILDVVAAVRSSNLLLPSGSLKAGNR